MAKRAKKAEPASTGALMNSDNSWRARDDLGTLTRAAEIAKDGGRLRAARAEAKRQMVSLERVAGSARKGKSRRERLADVEL